MTVIRPEFFVKKFDIYSLLAHFYGSKGSEIQGETDIFEYWKLRDVYFPYRSIDSPALGQSHWDKFNLLYDYSISAFIFVQDEISHGDNSSFVFVEVAFVVFSSIFLEMLNLINSI